jgi:hypothetical protein
MTRGLPLTHADRAPWLAAIRARLLDAFGRGQSLVTACSALEQSSRSILAEGVPISVIRVGGLHGLRSTATSSPGARPRVRFALVTTQTAVTLALLGGTALLLRSLWNVVNVPPGFDAERVVTLRAGLSPVRYPTIEHGAVFFDELLARARAMPGAVLKEPRTA